MTSLLGLVGSLVGGRKRKRPAEEPEDAVDDSAEPSVTFCCSVCLDVLHNPVTLPCSHTFDLACLKRLPASALATSGRGAVCPMCRSPLPLALPAVNRQMADLVEAVHPRRVAQRRAQVDRSDKEFARLVDVVRLLVDALRALAG